MRSCATNCLLLLFLISLLCCSYTSLEDTILHVWCQLVFFISLLCCSYTSLENAILYVWCQLTFIYLLCYSYTSLEDAFHSMNEEIRPLATDEPVELKKWQVQINVRGGFWTQSVQVQSVTCCDLPVAIY